MNVLALLVLTLSSLGSAHADPSPWATLDLLRNGRAPTAPAADFDLVKQKFSNSLIALKTQIKRQTRADGGTCKDFGRTSLRTVDSLRKSLDRFNVADLTSADASSVLARTRLLLTIPSFQVLNHLFARQREGGFGLLTGLPDQTCAYADRDALAVQFARSSADADVFRDEALGDPGLLGLDQLVDRLLALADVQQAKYDFWSYSMIGGSVVASALLWQFATPLLVARFGVGGATSKWVFFGAGVAESVAYLAIEYSANPEPEQRPGTRAPTYAEMMREVDALVDSAWDQPQLYVAYVSVIQAQTAALVANWTRANINLLNTPETP